MKQYILPLTYCLSALAVLTGCAKQTTPEPVKLIDTEIKNEEYYAALRAYKKSDHAIVFGWHGSSGSPSGSNMENRYGGIPDSMDIVGLWSGYPADDLQWKELRYAQKVKGTRFVITMFGSGVDNLRKKNFPDRPVLESIDSVAKSIADTVKKYGMDGFDLDYEPNFGDRSIFGYGPKDAGGDVYTQRLFKALSKYMGPASGSGQLLIIDGENEPGIEPYIDFLIQQAYGSGTFAALQNRYRQYGFNGVLPTKKFVVAENFEQYGGFGASFMYNGVNVGSTTGMALWNPTQGRKGGIGAYQMQKDYASSPPYKYLREAIQIMNPAPVKRK